MSRILKSLKKHITTTCTPRELHWLPVALRIEFKILILNFKAYHGIGPKYLEKDMLIEYTPHGKLCS